MTAVLSPVEVLLVFSLAGGLFAVIAIIIEIIVRWKT